MRSWRARDATRRRTAAERNVTPAHAGVEDVHPEHAFVTWPAQPQDEPRAWA